MCSYFPGLALVCSVIVALYSLYAGNEQGLGYAAGLTTAAGTAYQYGRSNRDTTGPD